MKGRRLFFGLAVALLGLLAPGLGRAQGPAPGPAQGSAAAAPPWRWEGPSPLQAQMPVRHEAVGPGGERCELTFDPAGIRTLACHLRGTLLWSRRQGQAQDLGGALLVMGDALIVAEHVRSATGCRLYAYDLHSGRERWRRDLYGIGPIGHSAYVNAVQLRAEGDRIAVYGFEAMGRYIERVAAATGAFVAGWHTPPRGGPAAAFAPTPPQPEPATFVQAPATPPPSTGPAAAVPWSWEGPILFHTTGVGDQVQGFRAERCSYTLAGGRSVLGCGHAGGPLRWSIEVPEGSGRAVILLRGGVLYVARFHPLGSGASVAAYDAGSGRELWQRGLYALGPIGHSQYWAELQLRWRGGRLVVYGAEAGGRYIEVLDPRGGAILGSQVLPAQP